MKNKLNKRNTLLLLSLVLVVGSIGVYYVYADGEDIMPDLEDGGFPFMHRLGFQNHMDLLNEEQRSQLATDIQDLIATRMEEWGIERPEPLLTEEQRSEIKAGIQELRDSGATVEEIREFFTETLTGWGVELPDMPERPHRRSISGCRGKGPRFFTESE